MHTVEGVPLILDHGLLLVLRDEGVHDDGSRVHHGGVDSAVSEEVQQKRGRFQRSSGVASDVREEGILLRHDERKARRRQTDVGVQLVGASDLLAVQKGGRERVAHRQILVVKDHRQGTEKVNRLREIVFRPSGEVGDEITEEIIDQLLPIFALKHFGYIRVKKISRRNYKLIV